MYGVFVNENGCIHYAALIVIGLKPIETRNRNTLKNLVDKRVAIVRTRRNKKPVVVGYVTITSAEFQSKDWLNDNRDKTFIPVGSMYDCTKKGKWCYYLENPETCFPYELPKDAIRHGFSYCEF